MKLWWNSVALHTLGTVSLSDQSSAFEPSDSPQKETVTLKFRIDSWRRGSFVDNREQLLLIHTALKTQNAKIKVVQELVPGEDNDGDLVMFDQTGNIFEHNFPSDPNE